MPSSLEDLDDLMMHIDKGRRIQRDGIHFMNLRLEPCMMNTNLA